MYEGEKQKQKNMIKREWAAIFLSFTASLAYLILLALFAAETIFVEISVFTYTSFWLASAITIMAGTIIAFKWARTGGTVLVLCCGICLCITAYYTLGGLWYGAMVIGQTYPYIFIYLSCFIAGILYIKVGNWNEDEAAIKTREAYNEQNTD